MDILTIMEDLARRDRELRSTRFLAPCIAGGRLQTRIAGMLRTFDVEPADFEGFGIFSPIDLRRASLAEIARPSMVGRFLELMVPVRLHLVTPLVGRSWLASPVNRSDVRQKLGSDAPCMVHLVEAGDRFDRIVARYDGVAFWFEEIDRRGDPLAAQTLRGMLAGHTRFDRIAMRHLTPEMRAAYALAQGYPFGSGDQHDDRMILSEALRRGGGTLESCRDRGDEWLVQWRTPDGELHGSLIDKRDLSVVSAGICLSGLDGDFDLTSLVEVVRQRPEWMRST